MNTLKRLFWGLRNMFLDNADIINRDFNVELIVSNEMNQAIKKWDSILKGNPNWKDTEDDVRSFNLAKFITDKRSRLITLDLGISISGKNKRAEFMQEVADDLLKQLPRKLSRGGGLGGMVIKWNGSTWDFIAPGNFGITDEDDNGEITGAVFASYATKGDKKYVRLEYHRFEGDEYVVTNRAYVYSSDRKGNVSLGTPIELSSVNVWKDMMPEARIGNLEKPLFSYFRVPGANNIDTDSPLGISMFAGAIEELRAIDIALSRKNTEIEDSKHITFAGQTVIKAASNKGIKLPRFVKGLGVGINDDAVSSIHEHTPSILTEQRVKDLNFNLSLAGVKCGFSEGVFVLNGQTGMITATQVEADDRDTILTIKDDRDALQNAIEQALYGVDALADLYDLAPSGEYEISFSFGDITYNYQEDKASWITYVMQGWIPAYLYFVKFEKMTEEEAKAYVAEAQELGKEQELFDKMMNSGAV